MQPSSFSLSPVRHILQANLLLFRLAYVARRSSIRFRGLRYRDIGLPDFARPPQLLGNSPPTSTRFYIESSRTGFSCVPIIPDSPLFHAIRRALLARNLRIPGHRSHYHCSQYTGSFLFVASLSDFIKSNRGSTCRTDWRHCALFGGFSPPKY